MSDYSEAGSFGKAAEWVERNRSDGGYIPRTMLDPQAPPQPHANQTCGGCKHPFSNHYRTYGGKDGCGYTNADQRDHSANRCHCGGFEVRYRYPWPGVQVNQ